MKKQEIKLNKVNLEKKILIGMEEKHNYLFAQYVKINYM
jgi:hypothetical protein